MGEFTWPVGVWSADGELVETVSALVDTGASYSVFPQSMLERLGIEKRYVLPFEQADGSVIEKDVGLAMLVINETESSMRVIFGEDGAESLIGANALQEFLLLVDPVEERLVPRTGRLKLHGGG
jgi:predicted aspartyl protease